MQTQPQPDFAAVYAEHAPLVRKLLARSGVRAADLDDVMQEVFVTVHRRLPSFEGRATFETWLCSVTWRVAANHLRRSRGRPELRLEPERSSSDVLQHPAGSERLRMSLRAVDERLRDLLALHYVGGLSVSELSALTGSARATIRERLERGRAAIGRRIWNTLTDHDPDAWLDRLAESFTQPLRPPRSPSRSPSSADKPPFRPSTTWSSPCGAVLRR